jgi:formylglycine-generating enzyme
MNRFVASCFVCAIALIAFQSASAITIDTVPIGNPGNPADTAVMTTDGSTGYGSVDHAFRLGKYDVTVGQYTAFLNAVAATDPFGLYIPFGRDDLLPGWPALIGISRSGVSGSYSYSVIGSANNPIHTVTWGDAARFSNWLHNGQPNGAEGAATTETGAYTLNGAITNAALSLVTRNAGAKWFIPSENEWYKAAYYDPVAGHYWRYATGTNTAPASAPPGDTPNTANFATDTDVALSGCDVDSRQGCLTDVGAYTASASPYGTFDQTGDVIQWNETSPNGAYRGLRGGAWDSDASSSSATYRSYWIPQVYLDDIGFRVATVPEPSTAALAIVAGGLTWALRKRFKKSGAEGVRRF